MKKNKFLVILYIFFTILYIYLVKNIDVQAIGPNGTSVGFAKFNDSVRSLIGTNLNLYKISEYLGYIILLIAGIYALVGLLQLIKRKSIAKVDKEIYLLGLFYIVVLMIYILFEKVIINYRPVILDGKLEASFPSSHTMLAICIGVSAVIVNRKYIKRELLGTVNTLITLLCLSVVVLRVLSGVHWATDIIGGLLISITLLIGFKYIYKMSKK